MTYKHWLLLVAPIAALAFAAFLGWAALDGRLGFPGGGRIVTPEGNWSMADARSFDGFPLFWAGEEFHGTPLTAVIRAEAENSVTFLYGSCEIMAYDAGCAVPFQMVFTPLCLSMRGSVVEYMKISEPFDLRGGLAQEYRENQLEVWTQDVSVTIFAQDRDSMMAMVEALRPLNPLARLEPDADLPPPQSPEELGCPSVSR